METQATYLTSAQEATLQPTAELARLDKEIQLMEIRSNAQFALTNVGQALKRFEVNQRMGKTYAHSTIVPATYNVQGVFAELVKKERKSGGPVDMNALWAQAQTTALANCAIAVDMAIRINADPMMVMQNLYIVNGRPSWSTSFLISTVNTCGKFERLRFRIFEDGVIGKVDMTETVWAGGSKQTVKKTFDGSRIKNLCCVAYTTAKGSTDVLESSVISCRLAVQEGWWTKDGSKWPNMTEQMLRYRAAAFWVRTYAPELSMGFHSEEEERDVESVPYTDMATGQRVEPAGYKAGEERPATLAELALKNARSQRSEGSQRGEGRGTRNEEAERGEERGTRREEKHPETDIRNEERAAGQAYAQDSEKKAQQAAGQTAGQAREKAADQAARQASGERVMEHAAGKVHPETGEIFPPEAFI